jgi:3-oxoacyl-[acyl-carrier protein] reductase
MIIRRASATPTRLASNAAEAANTAGREDAMGRVQDQVAVVTGAAHGLGRAIALRLAEEGARLVVGDVDAPALDRTVAEIGNAGAQATGLVGDVTEDGPAARLIAAAVDRYGRLDTLVNNVGGSRNARIWEMTADDWDFTLRLNLRSTFLCTRAAVPHMMRQRSGRIICLSSGAREGTPWTAYYQGGAAYSTAKAGVHGFIRDVALELAEYGIRVNAVAPGPIDTERTGAMLRRLNETAEYSPNRMTPLRRLGEPIEVANAVLFLASDEASYITGVTLSVAGGR